MTEHKRFLCLMWLGVVWALTWPVAWVVGQGAGALGDKGPQVDQLLRQIAAYDYGGSREPLTQLTELE